MITRLEEISVTKESYPFASAERYLKLSERGYVEKEYYMYGTANVYETADERGGVRVRTADAPYTNRIIVRAPQDTAKCSGNVVVEIINPTSFMEIDRMWILGWKKFVREPVAAPMRVHATSGWWNWNWSRILSRPARKATATTKIAEIIDISDMVIIPFLLSCR